MCFNGELKCCLIHDTYLYHLRWFCWAVVWLTDGVISRKAPITNQCLFLELWKQRHLLDNCSCTSENPNKCLVKSDCYTLEALFIQDGLARYQPHYARKSFVFLWRQQSPSSGLAIHKESECEHWALLWHSSSWIWKEMNYYLSL